jgi:septum formation protein
LKVTGISVHSSGFSQQDFMGKKIILASGSPRRKELLMMAGISFEIFVPDVNEDPFLGEKPDRMVKRLAREKALAVLRKLPGGRSSQFIIAADTTVVNPSGKILGKPDGRRQAVEMLQTLQGKVHHVFTGYSILFGSSGRVSRKVHRVVGTRVHIRKMSLLEIKRYVDLGESFDKAGAYAAQGFGMTIIERINGSYTNVVGLPMTELVSDLKDLGWKP